MTKFFSLMSLIGLFSVLCFTQCKKKNNDSNNGSNPPPPSLVAISEATLTGAPYGWAITGLTADKPINPSVPTSTDWFTDLKLGDQIPTFIFSTDKTYTLLPKFMGRISTEGTWSLSIDKTSVSIADNLVLKITEASDTKIVATIAYPYYGSNQTEIANLIITLTKSTQSYESLFPLVNTRWVKDGDNTEFVDFDIRFGGNGVMINTMFTGTRILQYTYDKNSSTGTAIDENISYTFTISGDKLTVISGGVTLVFTKQVS